ncbi:MAG: GC-type dockerin domain-anchored protein [Planctomycetota bacterium]
MQKHQVRGIAALIAGSGFAVGDAAAQPTVEDWLLPQTGLWSDEASWANGDVPDTLDEIARISPDPGEGLGTPAALVDQSFTIEALEGSGILDIVIQQNGSLAVGSLIQGTGPEPLRVIVGDETPVPRFSPANRDPIPVFGRGSSSARGEASLELIGTGDSRTGRANLNNVQIRLAGPASELIASEETRIRSDSVIAGAGRIFGSFVNSGRIVAQSSPDGEVITIDGAEIRGSGVLTAEQSAELRFEGASVIGGIVDAADGKVEIRDSDFRFTEMRGFDRGVAVRSPSTFTDVVLDSSVELLVGSSLRYTATDGVFLSQGDLLIRRSGRLDFDDTPENALIIDGGTITLDSGWVTAQADDDVYIFPGATIEGSGRVSANVVNLGDIDARIVDPEFPRSAFTIESDLTQLGLGRISTGIAQRLLPEPGPIELQNVVVDGDVVLGGELFVEYFAIDRGLFVGQPFTVLLARGSDSQIIGEFDRVVVDALFPGVSPFPRVEYADTEVRVTVFCRADVNRDGLVAPNDFAAWVAAFNAGDPLADQNGDGMVAQNDLNAWVVNFQDGCRD